jgi:hypothetical protein
MHDPKLRVIPPGDQSRLGESALPILARSGAAREFAVFFAEGWRQDGVEAFLDWFRPRVLPETRWIQPLAPTRYGMKGLEQVFRPLLAAIPDYAVEVDDWAGDDRVVYLWLTQGGTIGGRRWAWTGCDRVVLDEHGRYLERFAVFDSARLQQTLMRSPRAWPALGRMRRMARRLTR